MITDMAGRSSGQSSGKTILVVEDEVLVRLELVDMLCNAGLSVLEAGNADEAIALLNTRPDIGVVLTDVQMPGSMDGIRLAHHIRKRWPPVELVVMSGNGLVPLEDLPERSAFVSKPFNHGQLLRQLVALSTLSP